MDEQTATLENNVPMESLSTTQADDSAARPGTRMRFTYQSGSKPLDGYTIKRGIGIGGFGEVYFALSDAGKEVALKRIQRNVDVELRGVSQCLNLKHGNLITLWDIRQDERGEGWVVMEYVPGQSLRDVLEDNPQGLNETQTMEWFNSVASGVAYLHDHGIVHRDLKPGNIFRDDDERIVKIGDYGLSKFISCSRRSGQTESVGTFHYMAPEIGKGVYGKEIDIYALGIILYEMLTGRVPFDGESSQEIIMKHLTAEPTVEDVPEPYRSVVRKSLAKDPDLRFSSVQAMLAALQSHGTEVSPNRPVDHSPRQNDAPATDQSAGRPNPGDAVAGTASAAATPAGHRQIEPMFIADEPMYIGHEEEIVLGDVNDVVDAEAVDSESEIKVLGTNNRSPEEPIARNVKGGWDSLVRSWNQSNMSTPVKVVLLVLIGFALLVNAQWLVPLCLVLGVGYGIYYGIRSLVLIGRRRSDPSHAVPGYAHRLTRRQAAEIVEKRIRTRIGAKPKSEVIAELSGSLLMSAVVVGALCLLAIAIDSSQSSSTDTISTVSQFSWLTITGVAGAWALIGIGKFWEASRGDALRRRFVMLASGLVVGLIAFGAGQLLIVEPINSVETGRFAVFEGLSGTMLEDGKPTLPACLLYFAGIFFILRWWRQTDPLRKTRLSLWSVGICLLWAFLMNQVCHFPLPWGVLLVGIIAFAVQIASPYLDAEARERIEADFQEA